MNSSNGALSARRLPLEVLIRERGSLVVVPGQALGFDRGADDALSWLTTGGSGPLAGEMVGLPIPAAAVAHELAAAEAVLAQPPGRCGRYAGGVLHALMWAQMVMREPPHTATMAARSAAARG